MEKKEKRSRGPRTLQEYKEYVEFQKKDMDLLVRENRALRDFVEKIGIALGGIKSLLEAFRHEREDRMAAWSVYGADKQREEAIAADAAAERRRARRRR